MFNDLSGNRVILVEDDFLIQMDLALTLEAAGVQVVTASTLSEGLELVDASFDAAILDIRLPDGEVYPIAEELEKRDTPLIFHSGNVEGSEIATRFPNAIALSKPVHEAQLLRAVTDGITGTRR